MLKRDSYSVAMGLIPHSTERISSLSYYSVQIIISSFNHTLLLVLTKTAMGDRTLKCESKKKTSKLNSQN